MGGTSKQGETTSNRSEAQSTVDRWKMAITAAIMAILVGSAAGFAFIGFGDIAGVAFVIGLVGAAYTTYNKRLPSEAIGSGLYMTSLLILAAPILYYLPIIMRDRGEETTFAEAGSFIGGVLGLLIWGFVALLVSIVIAGIGYLSKRRAEKKLDSNVTA